MSVDSLRAYFYSHDNYNGTKIFYDWIRQITTPETRLLNLGAGPPTKSGLRTFRGEVLEVVGADIDRTVLKNSELDRGFVIENNSLPFPNDYFDVAFSDYVIEHVEFPEIFLSELHRVMKSGGQFFFRTPNKYHYVSFISAVTPHWFHSAIANRVRGLPAEAHEPWPTYYRLNSRRALKAAAQRAGFRSVELRMIEAEPSYLEFHSIPFLMGIGYERTVNSTRLLAGARANIFGRFVK